MGQWGFKIIARAPVSDALAKEVLAKIGGMSDEMFGLLICKLALKDTNLDIKLAEILLTANMSKMRKICTAYVDNEIKHHDGIYKNKVSQTSTNFHTGEIIVNNQRMQPVPEPVQNDLDFADVFGLARSSSKKINMLWQTDYENVKFFQVEHEGAAYRIGAWNVFSGKSEDELNMEHDSAQWKAGHDTENYEFDLNVDKEFPVAAPYVDFPELHAGDSKLDGCYLEYLGQIYTKLETIKDSGEFEDSKSKKQISYKWLYDILRPEVNNSSFSNKSLTIWTRQPPSREASESDSQERDYTMTGKHAKLKSRGNTYTGEVLVYSEAKGSTSNTSSFVEIFRINDVIHGFRLTEKGRMLNRTLCFVSDLR
jgi:hypothetical protein